MVKENITHMESYSGRRQVYSRIQKMIEEARSVLRIMTTENGIVRMYKVREQTYREAIQRGVMLKIALPITKNNLWFVERFVQMGAEIRHLPDAARNRLVNVDGCEVMAHLTSKDDRELEAEDDYGVWIDMREVVELTAKFFDDLWEKLSTYRERRSLLKFKVWVRLLLVILYFGFVACSVRLILVVEISERAAALLCGIAATIIYVLGEKAVRSLYKP